MHDIKHPPQPRREVSARGAALFSTLFHLWPYIWPADRRDLKARVVFATVLIFAAKLATIAVPFTFKWATDALAGHGTAPDRGRQLAGLGDGGAGGDDARLWRHPHPDGGADAMARRHFRQGGDERGAAACAAHLRAHAPSVTALPSRAQDRRPDAHPRTRAQRHRDHRAHGAAAAAADHRRTGFDRLGAAVPFRLALRGGDHDHRRALCRLHLLCHRVAHRHPPQDERQRQRRQHQGHRFAAQLRDGQIFLRRAARGQALRSLDGALRGRQRQGLYLAGGAQCRPGGLSSPSGSRRRWCSAPAASRPAPIRSATSS